MKKIIFFINNLGSGGSNKMGVDLSNQLSVLYNTHVVSLYGSSQGFLSKKQITLSKIQETNIVNKIISLFNGYFLLKKLLKKEPVDTIFTFSMETTLLALLIKVTNRNIVKKVIMTQHENSLFIKNHTALQGKIYESFLYSIRLLEKHIYKIISVSYNTQKTLIDFGFPLKKIIVIWNRINGFELTQMANEKIQENSPYILNIGNISKIKNQLLLIESFAIISQKIPHKLMFLGVVSDDRYYKKLIKKIDELQIKDRVGFLGFDKNPYKYIKGATVLTSTSFSESFGLTIVESMFLGVPVVSTRHEGGIEVLDNGQYGILTGFSSEEYASALLEILLDKDVYDKYVKKGKERSEIFSQEEQLKKYISLIES